MAAVGDCVRWTFTCRWWLVVVTCIAMWRSTMAAQVSAQTCTTVADSYLICEQSGNIKVSLSCPDKYIIKVLSLSYRVAPTPVCPAAYSGDPPADHCLVSADPIQGPCNNRGTCAKDVVRDTSGTCGGNGAHYIRIVHYCEPLLHLDQAVAGVTSMQSMATLSGQQLVYIASDPPEVTGITFTDTSLGCIITVPDNTQINFRMLQFDRSPPQSGCNQKLQMWDGTSYVRSMCAASLTETTVGGCDVSENTFYIKYLNSDPSVKVSFFFSVGVSHRSVGVDMLCGLPVSGLPAVVTTAPTTQPPTTQAPGTGKPDVNVAPATEAPQDMQSLKLILIVVGVIVALIVLVIIIGVVIRKFSSKSSILEGSEHEDLTQNKPAFNYVRNIYLHGSSSTKLVVDRRRSSTPSGGSMGLKV